MYSLAIDPGRVLLETVAEAATLLHHHDSSTRRGWRVPLATRRLDDRG